jgi:5-methylcytosine-specific restriction enzyme subunit McrC
MLEYAGYFPQHQQALAPMVRQDKDWFELLTRIFAVELIDQWKHGPYRNYQLVEDDLGFIKGRWQVSQQLRRPARDHRFDISYDEFTSDNGLSRVFRYVTEQLWMRTRDDGNRRLLGELRQWLDPVRLLPNMRAKDISQGIITRLNDRFEPALNLAKLFLREGSLEITPGDLQSFAFVFDMNHLFEEYIVSFIKKHREIALPGSLQDCTLHPQTRHFTRHLAVSPQGHSVFRLKPDLAFRRNDRFPLLLDTKYKMLSANDSRFGTSQSDFYQMFAYVHRYQSPGVVLLFPQAADPVRAQYALKDHNASILVATVNLHRNLSRSEARRALADELREILSQENFYGTVD